MITMRILQFFMIIHHYHIPELYQENIWESPNHVTMKDALNLFIKNQTPHTGRNYLGGFKKIAKILERNGIPFMDISLGMFSTYNLENILDLIKREYPGKIGTKQARCGCFISFTQFLQRKTRGMIRKALVDKTTFQRIRKKAHTGCFTHKEWVIFIQKLKDLSHRDYLIAKAVFQGAKRISEVLHARIENIDWEKGQIKFKQSKSKIVEDCTVISYSSEYMKELKFYLKGRITGYIFLTRKGNTVTPPHMYRSFMYACVMAKLEKRIHPHMLRTTAITSLFQMGYHSDEIMKVSGHSCPTSVIYYDKNELEDNLTKHTKLC